jgi:hypothetical protein
MSPQSRLRRIGWLAALGLCTLFYVGLHLKVHAVQSEVIGAERQIVALEERRLLLETEFETRASQERLATLNRVEFGYVAPGVGQFVEDERDLSGFGTLPNPGAPLPIRVANASSGTDAPPFPRLVSPLTGRTIDEELVEPAAGRENMAARSRASVRIPLAAMAGSAGE